MSLVTSITEVVQAIGADVKARVPTSRTINGKPLTADITLTAADVGASGSSRYSRVNAQTGTSYTIVAMDEGGLTTLSNTAAITVTLPQDSALTFPIGAGADFMAFNTGIVTFAAGTGATAVGTPSLVLRARYSGATVRKIAANTWWVSGDMTT